jgi:phosphohistidine swiveling domain-containing protein
VADHGAAAVRLPGGLQIAFDWVYPEAPEQEWQFEREHWPAPMTPMETWIWRNGQEGADRAWQEVGLEPPPMFRRFQLVGPVLYVNATPPTAERIAAMAPPYLALHAKYGGALAFWKEFCEPRIRQSCDGLAALGASADLRAAAELLFYGFHQTFTSLGLLFLPSMRLSALLTQYEISDPLTALELTLDSDNATQHIDEEIWRLAELARATPAVARILRADETDALDALRREPRAASFLAAFDALIGRHGRRSEGWMLTLPTWRERPQAALALVCAHVRTARVAPDEIRAGSARRREKATARVLAALPPERHEEFRQIVGELDGYVPIREERAYWQLGIVGEMRALLLRAGQALVEAGRIERGDDVLFVTPDDLAAGEDADLRERVAAARRAYEDWCRVEPPAIIGTPGAAAAEAETRRAAFLGSPASRGTATGPVRILHSPEEGHKVRRGDILVCVMTTPAWTPLFAIARGIVTETGGALSHPAITAREYGIPAVVALAGATTKLKDGDVVTIDGGTGTVTFARAGDPA